MRSVTLTPVKDTPEDQVAEDTLSSSAYTRIKAAIVSCEFPPGTEITEGQLAEHLGLGKAPIRSGLVRLSHEGLLRPLPRRGYLVTPVTLDDVQNVFQLRLMLEPKAARLAAGHLTESHIRRLHETLDESKVAGRDTDISGFLRLNKTFHVTIAEATGNYKLANFISMLLDEVERILHLLLENEPRGPQFQDEHRELFDALLAGEAEKAERLAYEQIKGGQELVLRSMLMRQQETLSTRRPNS